MTEVKQYKQGQFAWVDFVAHDVDAAKRFYSKLLGWDPRDERAPDGTTVYTTFLLRGRPVAGLGPAPEMMKKAGAPPMWNNYVWTDDVDKLAAKVTEHGGKVHAPPMDIFEEGRMAMFADPLGATFSAWQAKKHKGAAFTGEPGAFCWQELYTNDVAKARAFYEKVLGWTFEKAPMPTEYFIAKGNGEQLAGMMKITPEMQGMPPSWLVYFAVADCDKSLVEVVKLGGKKVMGPHDIPNVGRFALTQDPTGGTFAIIKLLPMQS